MTRLFTATIVALLAPACGPAERASPVGAYADPTPLSVAAPNSAGPCTDGEEHACRTVHSFDGGIDCFEGVKRCSGGLWGVCSDPKAIARPGSCTVDSLEIPSNKLAIVAPSEFASAFRDAEPDLPGGKLAMRLSHLKSAAKLTIAGATIEVGWPAYQTLRAERDTSFKLRFTSFARVVEIPIVAVSVEAELTTACDGVESLTVSLTIPELAGSVRLGSKTIREAMGPSPVGARGWSLVFQSLPEGS